MYDGSSRFIKGTFNLSDCSIRFNGAFLARGRQETVLMPDGMRVGGLFGSALAACCFATRIAQLSGPPSGERIRLDGDAARDSYRIVGDRCGHLRVDSRAAA